MLAHSICKVYKYVLLRVVDLPYLTSITSSGNSFINTRILKLSSLNSMAFSHRYTQLFNCSTRFISLSKGHNTIDKQ